MPARFRHPIRSRLQLSMTALIVSLTALSGLCMVLLVFWFERTLFYNHLVSDLNRYVTEYAGAEHALSDPQGDTTFYKLTSTDHPLLPAEFQGYPEGNFEVFGAHKVYNLIVVHRSPWVYVLAQDQSEFERYEVLAVAGIVVGFLLISGLGYFLSRYLASQVLLPVMTLAAAVEAEPASARSADFDPGMYPNDEVGALARAVRRYSDQVANLLDRERQFTADVSHELRTPMMVIQAATDLLQESATDNPAQKRVVARIDRAVKDMQSQMALYLQLAREPEEHHRDVSCTLLEAGAAAQAVWQQRADEKGIVLSCEGEATQASPSVPQVLISAVLNNLLNNALNHTEHGAVTIEVGHESIAVRDSGSGIDPEVAAKIFERGVRSVQGSGSRYGLGLSISKRICDHQGWRLEVRPNHPVGTVFTLIV